MADTADDPFLWLEDVEGEKSLEWVKERNAITTKELGSDPAFASTRDRLLSVYNSEARIPYVSKYGPHFYNFWRDKHHVRGLWRRTTLDEYRKSEPKWETVLDLDALAQSENENWIWGGQLTCLAPDEDRCLVFLSRGGGDAKVVREFDLLKKQFVSDGFNLPAAKSYVAWRDRNSLYVGTDFGSGSLTTSGYPRITRLWRRGQSVTDAQTIFEGKSEDVAVSAWTNVDRQGTGYVYRNFVGRSMTYFEHELFLHEQNLRKLDIPLDIDVTTFNDQALLTLRFDWEVDGRRHLSGSLLAMPWNDFVAGKRNFNVLFAPTQRTSLESFRTTRNYVLVNALDNIRSRVYAHSLRDGAWTQRELPTPEFGSVDIEPIDSLRTDEYFLTATDFLTPSTLSYGTVENTDRERLKQTPAFFDAKGLRVSQHEATSKDGTRVPYFQVSRAELDSDGSNPTLLYGYGGFQISSTPGYSAGIGIGWLEHGGVYVLANIRGGGEFGPAWHIAALKENRQRSFDDFIAIAEDLIKRKVTSPEHLGIMGGSNGGLLVGAALTQRPDLFGAVVCQVPLLDMRRYHKLLAGASWMAEYGDPDVPEQWGYISKYSPYQNLQPNKRYPRVLFLTSTRDDRVHPGHARKMAAKMQSLGQDILYYENIEGGHGGSANNEQAAYMSALAYRFLRKELRAE
ncbi:MAG TPA: prolyl oligopeptidase family serine peptidase [Steroidobacteraceae bacterium]|nr:prolyl oligopeptidase family serine peptidase [Steroidobacteraceae bacterium]